MTKVFHFDIVTQIPSLFLYNPSSWIQCLCQPVGRALWLSLVSGVIYVTSRVLDSVFIFREGSMPGMNLRDSIVVSMI